MTKEGASMKPLATTTKLKLLFAVTGLVLLQLLSMLDTSFSSGNDNSNSRYIAFAFTNGQPISQKLNYAHFLPLTNNSKLHQVKVIVDYSPVSATQNAVMKVYAANGTLVKISSLPNGLKTITAGKAQFATSLSDSTIKQVTAHIMFTDTSKVANFSNPLNVKLNLGQTIQQTS
jgi:hypothetical protein